MPTANILIIDNNPETIALLEQILPSDSFRCTVITTGEEAIKRLESTQPDLILLNLESLEGLSGKDTLVGFRGKNYDGPVIMMAPDGHEADAVQAFRLGATDFILKPIRPPEAVAAINKALTNLRREQERADLIARLQITNELMTSQVKELTLLTNVGQILTGMRNIDELLDVVMSSMIDISQADHASVLLYEEDSEKLRLSGGQNLTLSQQDMLGEIVNDDLASMVLTTHQPLVASGEGLRRFRLPRDIKSVVYVPMIAHNKPIGVLTIGNHNKRDEFLEKHGKLLKAMGDYVAIGITNLRLFSRLDNRARNNEVEAQNQNQDKKRLLVEIKDKVYDPLRRVDSEMGRLSESLASNQKAELNKLRAQTRQVLLDIQQIVQNAQEDRKTSSGIRRISID